MRDQRGLPLCFLTTNDVKDPLVCVLAILNFLWGCKSFVHFSVMYFFLLACGFSFYPLWCLLI